MPMRLRSCSHILLSATLSFLLIGGTSCTQEPRPGTDGLVLLSLDTRAGDPGHAGTFRVALFNTDYEFSGRSGSYCAETQTHVDANTGTPRTWLLPCRVDDAGAPLKADGSPLADGETLADADHRSAYGLRWDPGLEGGRTLGASLVAVSPAVRIKPDENQAVYAYVDWTPDKALYISDPPASNSPFSGSWLDGQYVYTSGGEGGRVPDLMDRRATIAIEIKCGELETGSVQSVTASNLVVSDRYYLRKAAASEDVQVGFTLNNAADYRHADLSGTQTLFDCGGTPMTLVKANGDVWLSTDDGAENRLYLPSYNYADETMDDTLRPVVTVKLGADPADPFVAKVVLNQKLDPMKRYIYTLYLSKAHVDITLTPIDWDDLGSMDASTVTPTYLGSVDYDTDWEQGGGGVGGGWHSN